MSPSPEANLATGSVRRATNALTATEANSSAVSDWIRITKCATVSRSASSSPMDSRRAVMSMGLVVIDQAVGWLVHVGVRPEDI